jgi:hypothetical protein
LLRENRVRPEDCFPVSHTQRVEGPLMNLSFSIDILAKGKVTLTDILKRSAMAEGGRWVWHAEKPMAQASRGGFAQRGRCAGQL